MLPRVAHQILQAAEANENGKDLMAKQWHQANCSKRLKKKHPNTTPAPNETTFL